MYFRVTTGFIQSASRSWMPAETSSASPPKVATASAICTNSRQRTEGRIQATRRIRRFPENGQCQRLSARAAGTGHERGFRGIRDANGNGAKRSIVVAGTGCAGRPFGVVQRLRVGGDGGTGFAGRRPRRVG